MNPIFVPDDLQLADAAEVRRTLQLLLSPGQVTELRILDGTMRLDRWASTLSGYFDDAEKLIAELENVTSAKAVYVIPNPIDPALLARAANRIRKAGKGETTSDKDIIARRWLLIDCDPQRASGISSTESEHQAALERCQKIADHLHYNCGWPLPMSAALAASIFHDSIYSVHEAKEYLQNAGVTVRGGKR